MGKKGKRNGHKIIELKTRDDRLAEVLDVFANFKEIGLSKDIEGVGEFFSMCRDYVNDGEGRSGKIKISGEKRIIHYILPTRKNTLISVNLKYDKNI